MTSRPFVTHRRIVTEYRIVSAWDHEFRQWFQGHQEGCRWSRIAVLTDEHVWGIYEDSIRKALLPLERPIVDLVLPPGEDSKDFEVLPGLVDALVRSRVHRRDLLLCAGGGVCCDIGGLLALLYMRGMDYVNLPTSLMAQIDGAIGGKVGANFGLRKNLLGGFCHPSLVLIDPSFLDTLPQNEFRNALAEALKIAIIQDDDAFLELLEKNTEALLRREPQCVSKLIEHCLEAKLGLLADDPYESELDRALNLGHSVAHALERLPVMPDRRRPSHGEAVAIGIAAATRYAFHGRYCSGGRAERLLRALTGFGLPLVPGPVDRDAVADQLSRIPEHRGGVFRLVVPADGGGVAILAQANIDTLVECLFPVSGLPL